MLYFRMAFGEFAVENGKALPLGATVTNRGVNFAVFSRHASGITLILFESAQRGSLYKEIKFCGKKNRTGDIWH